MANSQTVDKLNESAVAALPFVSNGQKLVFERNQQGFGILIGTTSKTFIAQVKVKIGGRWTTRRLTLGSTDQLNLKAARKQAALAVIDLRFAKNKEIKKHEITLLEAWQAYELALLKKGRSLRTIEGYARHIDTHLKAWQNQSLRSLSEQPREIQDLHNHLTENRGPYCANGVLRTLSAIFSHAARFERDLRCQNPAEFIDKNAEHRRQTALAPADFKIWNTQLAQIDNPVRRGFHLLTLLTGSRPSALKSARWEHLDFNLQKWHFPRPKGGANRKFDIPLSNELIQVLRDHEAEIGQLAQSEWLFPNSTVLGHISETKEPRHKLFKWGNDLRQSFRTCAYLAEVDEVSIHLLMNHRLSGVNAGYLNLIHMWPRLTQQQSKIIQFINKNLKGDSK